MFPSTARPKVCLHPYIMLLLLRAPERLASKVILERSVMGGDVAFCFLPFESCSVSLNEELKCRF